MEYLKYSIIAIIILLLEIIYIPIAKYYQIGNVVTPRSSHHKFSITGGGFIFYFSAILFYLIFDFTLPKSFITMLVGATALALISFYDDIKNISPWIRLVIHILVVATTFNQILFNGYYDIFLLLLICGVGFINAFNFMDGINGILTGYTIVTLSTLLYQFNDIKIGNGLTAFTITLIITTTIFGCFNFRKKAKCFAGDVGAIVMGFFILYLMSELILNTSDASALIFLIVYAIDSVYTIFQRLFAGENIFLPHRHHLYQILANQWHIHHYKVAIGYSVIQLLINCIYLYLPDDLKWSYFIIVTIILTIIYFIIKRSPKSKRK